MLNVCSPACDCCHPEPPRLVVPAPVLPRSSLPTQGVCVTCGTDSTRRCAKCGCWLHENCEQESGCRFCMEHPRSGYSRRAGRVGLDLAELVLADESSNPDPEKESREDHF